MTIVTEKIITDLKNLQLRGMDIIDIDSVISIVENYVNEEKSNKISDYVKGHTDREKDIFKLNIA